MTDMFSIRKNLFFINDIMHGGKIRNHISDIEAFFQNPQSQQESLHRRLKELLSHAAGTTDFYRKYNGIDDLSRYPIIKKNQLQQFPAGFLSSRYPAKKLKERKTSGSYGTPMKVYFSAHKMARHYAELIYYNKSVGMNVGERYINITTNKKGKIEQKLKNVVIVNPAVMNKSWYTDTLSLIRSYKNSFIIGFPSVLYALSKYIMVNISDRRPFRMKGIIAIAEPLDQGVLKNIQDAFQCRVYNRYATMETGVIGHSSGSENTIRINRASYIVEIMAFDEDRPVKEGEEGRIVVTDLYSHAMPLIRYEIGDTAVLVSKAGFGAEDIENPQGRIIETIFATNGSRISWAIIYDYMIAEPNIIQYQFQQTGKRNYQLLLITSDKYSRNSREVLSRKFLNLLGDDAVLDFRYTDLIPALTSGKRPMIINSYTKNNPG